MDGSAIDRFGAIDGSGLYEVRARIRRLDHIAIAAADAEGPLRFYSQLLGLRGSRPQLVPDEEVIATFLEVPGSRIEILEPTSETSPVARFIRERGGGLHHVCFEVVDLEGILESLKASGVELIDEKPRPGRQGERIAFVHPRSAHHVLIELAEPQLTRDSRSASGSDPRGPEGPMMHRGEG